MSNDFAPLVAPPVAQFPLPPARPPFAHWSPDQWADWRQHMRQRITTAASLAAYLRLSSAEADAFEAARERFSFGVTPYYLSLVNPDDPQDPIRAQIVPAAAELTVLPEELADPLAEDSHMPVPGLTHRYPDRVLLYTTHTCAVYCRFCTRKRKVGAPESAPSREAVGAWVAYIREHPEVRDVILSGGDPLSLSDERVLEIVAAVRDIPHVDYIRIHTRMPTTLPMRITPALVDKLKAYHPIFVHTHFNHPAELTSEAEAALRLLADGGFSPANQMVLLKGVNDDPALIEGFFRRLLKNRVRPYYIHQCDMAEGVSHFRTPLATGVAILRHLRGRIGGFGVPQYAVDLPGGGGKVTVAPDWQQSREGRRIHFLNWAGRPHVYDEPPLAPPEAVLPKGVE